MPRISLPLGWVPGGGWRAPVAGGRLAEGVEEVGVDSVWWWVRVVEMYARGELWHAVGALAWRRLVVRVS